MTPLAANLINQTVIRPKHREGIWVEEQNIKLLREDLSDIHCFEATQVLPLLRELALEMKGDWKRTEGLFNKFSFLPAPKTWIEWMEKGANDRFGILLNEHNYEIKTAHILPELPENVPMDASWCSAMFYCAEYAQHIGFISMNSGDYYDGWPPGKEIISPRHFPKWFEFVRLDPGPYLLSKAHCLLTLINSPKIIGRCQHMPNAGLERRLTRGFGPGMFPLHAWTEILLNVAKPTEIDDGLPHEAHLTGQRALHFVRKHIRIRLGRLEYVSAHWRGDPAMGIKRSRYEVTA